jgi:hypothetical protein
MLVNSTYAEYGYQRCIDFKEQMVPPTESEEEFCNAHIEQVIISMDIAI